MNRAEAKLSEFSKLKDDEEFDETEENHHLMGQLRKEFDAVETFTNKFEKHIQDGNQEEKINWSNERL